MSKDFDRTNSGAIQRNEDKDKPDGSAGWPDMKGSCDVLCPACGQVGKFWLSGWAKVNSHTGKKFLSLAFKPKDAPKIPKPMGRNEYAEAKGRAQEIDDDIPF